MGKRDKEAPAAPPAAPFNNPFGGLGSRLGIEPAPPPAAPPAPAPRAEKPGPARAVVRMERAGRGGKTVTVVEKLGLPPRELTAWLGELKRTLGCGGALEGDAIVLQGDLRERAGKRLEAMGVRKVTLG